MEIIVEIADIAGNGGITAEIPIVRHFGHIGPVFLQIVHIVGGQFAILVHDGGDDAVFADGEVIFCGLIGEHGDYNSCEGEGRGGIVKCDITYDWSNEKWYGMILGYYWGKNANIVLGTEDEPIKVLGGSMTYSKGTTEVTADNYTLYTHHSSEGGKTGSKPFTVHAKFGE